MTVFDDYYRGASLIRNCPPQHPTVGLGLRPYGGPTGGTVSFERGTLVFVLFEDQGVDLIAANICDTYSMGPSIRLICTR